jgi:CPA2 family monovalent cation:H+ antiporter-2
LLLIQDLAVLLVVAGVMGLLFRRLGLSVVVGYLVAGMMVGPYMPPFSLVAEPERIRTLSQLGLVFLMFFVGMRLHLTRLREMGWPTVLATGLGAWLVYLGSQLIAGFMGWDGTAALVLAGMAMVSSSAIISTIFSESGCGREAFARRAMGVTVLEDVVAVVMLTLISARLQAADVATAGVPQVLGVMAAFVVLAVVVALLMVPRLLRRFSRSSDGDLKVVVVAGLVFAAAWVAAWSGYSVALGAFLLGTVAGGTPFRGRIEKALAGTHSLFAAVFFVSIGMLLDPALFLRHGWMIAGVAVAVMMVRMGATFLAQLAVAQPVGLSARTAMALVPIGEFSYVMAQMGTDAGAVPESFGALAVGISLVTALAAPGLVRSGAAVSAQVERLEPGWFRNLSEAYTTWLEAVDRRQHEVLWWRLTRVRLGQVVLEVLILAGLLLFAPPLHQLIEGWVARSGWVVPGLGWIFAAVIGLGVLLLVVAIWRNVAAIGLILEEGLDGTAPVGRGLKVGTVASVALQGLTLLGLLWIIFAASPAPQGVIWDELVLLVVTLAAAWFFSRRLIRWHSQLRIRLGEAVEGTTAPSSTGVRLLGEASQAWGVRLAEMDIPEGSPVGGRALRELGLRSNYGCTVVEIQRQGLVVAAPQPEERIYPGDVLVLAGAEASLNRVRNILAEDSGAEEVAGEPVEMDEVFVGSSARAGRSLAELGIQTATGVTILAIRRDNRMISHPPATETIHEGDALLALGRPTQIRRFVQWLGGTDG